MSGYLARNAGLLLRYHDTAEAVGFFLSDIRLPLGVFAFTCEA